MHQEEILKTIKEQTEAINRQTEAIERLSANSACDLILLHREIETGSRIGLTLQGKVPPFLGIRLKPVFFHHHLQKHPVRAQAWRDTGIFRP